MSDVSNFKSEKVDPLTITDKKHCFMHILKGSLSVEAALIMPLFMFAVVFILNIFNLVGIQIKVYSALQYTSRTMAAYEPDNTALTTAGAYVISNGYIMSKGLDMANVRGGLAGVSYITSDFSGDYVTLRGEYRVKQVFDFFHKRCVVARSRVDDEQTFKEDVNTYNREQCQRYHEPSASHGEIPY